MRGNHAWRRNTAENLKSQQCKRGLFSSSPTKGKIMLNRPISGLASLALRTGFIAKTILRLALSLAALLWVQSVYATTVSICSTTGDVTSCTGTLSTPEDVFTDTFNADGSSVTVQTYGFGGGKNAAGKTILAGGFDSLVALFSGPATNATVLADLNSNPIASADSLSLFSRVARRPVR
jgi:hypothetical protein